MTPHGKANHRTHTLSPGCFSRWHSRHDLNTIEGTRTQLFHYKWKFSFPASQCAALQLSRVATADRFSHCEGLLPVQSTVLRFGGVPWANHQSRGVAGPVANGEQVFPGVHQIPETGSPSRRARSGHARQRPNLPSAPRSQSAAPNSGSRAIAIPPTRSSWSCSMSCVRASGPEEYPRGVWYGSQGPQRSILDGPSRMTETGRLVGEVGRGEADFRSRLALSQSALVPAMAADTATSPDLTDRPVAVVVNRSRAKATRGKTGTAAGKPSVRRSTAGTGLRVGEAIAVWPATSEFMDVTAGETALIQLCLPDWPVGPQINQASRVEAGLRTRQAQGGSIRRSRTSERFPGTAARGLVCQLERSSPAKFIAGWSSPVARKAHNLQAVSSNLTPATSSGDGLGNHQPGSHTWGGFNATAPSGRARSRAICPAVARSSYRRAA